MSRYETVIGLEVHAQLLTRSKMFCACDTTFGAEPNTSICPICTGQPGTLPVVNRRAVEFAIRAGLATHCSIQEVSEFSRKNYFYPDLPKGYQISQYDRPICVDGYIDIPLSPRGEGQGEGALKLAHDWDRLRRDALNEWETRGPFTEGECIDVAQCHTTGAIELVLVRGLHLV